MRQICVLGDGQLGCMLRQAGEPLGIKVWLIGSHTKPRAVFFRQNIITAEIEQWPRTDLICKLAKRPEFINRDIFPIITDRLMQKQFLEKLNLNTTPWQLLTNKNDWSSIFNKFGENVVVKYRIGGYNGHNQWHINTQETDIFPNDYYGKCIVEQKINFIDEISLIGARAHNGSIVFYPLIYNLHQNGVLRASISFPKNNVKKQIQAEIILATIMQNLNYVGVMAVEFFVVSDKLIINEISPRVHNSGHWTQNGASISQFELHLRAVIDLPLPRPVVINPSIMINLIGTNLNYDWLNLPLIHLHWYNKIVRSGRKVGHLNLSGTSSHLNASLNDMVSLMSPEYIDIITRMQTRLINNNL